MHLIERYSASCGIKIDKPFILSKFFPMSQGGYISFHPFSKYPAKCYDFWQDVVDILLPYLNERNIKLVQIGAKGERVLQGVYNTVGQTTLQQSAFIVGNSILHLGADSFATHVASHYNKKIVCIYSNNFAHAVRPYFNNPEDNTLIEPNREERKPSFSAEENPKSINEITPEKIANAVLEKLNIKSNYEYETFWIGKNYANKFIETVPNQIIDPKEFGINSIVVRMDYLHDEDCLRVQLEKSKCCIVTNYHISEEILNRYRHNITEVIYNINENHNPTFVKKLFTMGLNSHLTTDLPEEDFQKIKIHYLDLPMVNELRSYKEPIVGRVKESVKDIYYSSCKKTLSSGKIYPSKAAWKLDVSTDSFKNDVYPIIKSHEFYQEIEYMKLLLKND